MSDVPTPPPTTPDAPQHPAPGGTYRPISGLAVTAFILSLVGILAAAAFWWVLALVPFMLGVLTMIYVDPSRRRGRVLGLWAICISLFVGALGFVQQRTARLQVERMAGSVLAALASDATDEEKDAALLPWMWEDAVESGVQARLRKRYAAVTAQYGAYKPSPDAGGPFTGMFSLMLPPDPEGYREVGREPGTEDDLPTPGGAFWADVTFEKGTLRLGLEIFGGQPSLKGMEDATGEGIGSANAQPWISDLRFYAPKGGG